MFEDHEIFPSSDGIDHKEIPGSLHLTEKNHFQCRIVSLNGMSVHIHILLRIELSEEGQSYLKYYYNLKKRRH